MITAAAIPQKITFRRFCAATPAAAMPTTMALSPARTISMKTTCPRAIS
jgi:hypothetical protein